MANDDERFFEVPDGASRDWTIESRERAYDGFYRIERLALSHAKHGGGRTPRFERELFVRGDVVGVLPYDRARDEVVLIEQFRVGAMHQDPDPWLVEIVAGMIDTDETPEAVAIRETREEAGLELDSVKPISRYLASPGATTEEVFVYLAETDLSNVAEGRFGLEHEAEDIRMRVVPAARAIRMLDTREVRNALSIVALQWLELHRAGLR